MAMKQPTPRSLAVLILGRVLQFAAALIALIVLAACAGVAVRIFLAAAGVS